MPRFKRGDPEIAERMKQLSSIRMNLLGLGDIECRLNRTADKLGVAYQTLWNWERSRSIPTSMDLDTYSKYVEGRLRQFLKTHGEHYRDLITGLERRAG